MLHIQLHTCNRYRNANGAYHRRIYTNAHYNSHTEKSRSHLPLFFLLHYQTRGQRRWMDAFRFERMKCRLFSAVFLSPGQQEAHTHFDGEETMCPAGEWSVQRDHSTIGEDTRRQSETGRDCRKGRFCLLAPSDGTHYHGRIGGTRQERVVHIFSCEAVHISTSE